MLRDRTGRDVTSALSSVLRTGLILGAGSAMALDEILFHQLLQWHNLYVHTSQAGRITSDGLLHLLSYALLAVGAYRLWRADLSVARSDRALLAGILMGLGGFNLYDGTVQHKLLQLHPVREGVGNQLPYDLTWNSVAILILAAGWLSWRSATRPGA
jgi:uncharacterized membrane protein